jgi:hypothetical protein
VAGVVIADTRVLVDQLELRDDDEARDVCDNAWASLISLDSSAACVVARRAAVLVAALVVAWDPW